MEVTTFIALWGAGLSTALAGFEIYKWLRSGKPKLRITVSGPMVSTDPRDTKEYMSVSVSNTGDAATTLTGLSYRYFDTSSEPNVKKVQATERGLFTDIIRSNVFPHRLEVGDEWRHALAIPNDLRAKADKGFLYIEVSDSYTDNALKHVRARLVVRE
jgi:hypothetical protein